MPDESLIKIKVPLPPDDPSGGEAEWLWAESQGSNVFALRNVPTFIMGMSYGDSVKAPLEDGIHVFKEVVQRSGHSTYRIYAKTTREDPEVSEVLQELERHHCDLESATSKIVSVDVLPEADINAVYKVLENAEAAGLLEFEEGHFGHGG